MVSIIDIFSGLMALGGSVIVGVGLRTLGGARLISNTPTSQLRSVPLGLAELSGTVRPITTVEAPMSGETCACYTYLVEEYRQGGSENGYQWTPIDADRSLDPFELDDGTGTIAIDPRTADLTLRPTRRWYSREKIIGRRRSVEESAKNAREVGLRSMRIPTPGARRYTLTTLKAGDQVYVLGTVAKEDELRIGKGVDGMYILSNGGERAVIASFRNRALVFIIGGIAFALFGIALIVLVP